MKINNKFLYKTGIVFFALILVAGCTNFEEFESEDLGTNPTATVSLVSAADSAITVDITSSANGFVAAILKPGSDNEVPEDPEVLVLNNVESNQYFYSEATASTAVTIVFTEGVEQNSAYEVMAVVADENGLLSTVEVLAVSTSDNYAPQLLGTIPEFAYDPIFDPSEPVILVFDELIQRGTGNFSFETFYGGQTGTVPEDNILIEDNAVMLQLPFTPLYGDYLWLHWEAGAIQDLSGNDVEALTTYLDADVGAFFGAYWGIINVEMAPVSISPDASVSQDAGFNIVVDFPEEIDISDVVDGDITLTYVDGRETLSFGVLLADLSVSGTSLTIAQTDHTPVGGTVTVDIPASLIYVGLWNPSAAVSETWEINSVAK